MGLFDPPAAKIRKRLPNFANEQYDEIVRLADERAPAHLSKAQIALFIAFAGAAWVASENRQGRLELGPSNGRYIQEMLEKCHERLGPEGSAAMDFVYQMQNEGLIELPSHLRRR